MKIRQLSVSESDRLSAKLLFGGLKEYYDFNQFSALDAFARNGQLTVSQYASHVRRVECWELGQEHEEALRRQTDWVRIGCSYSLCREAASRGEKYDLIVIDTPQGLHRDSEGEVHTEHFDFLDQSVAIMEDRCLVVLYVNKRPYDKSLFGSHGYDEYNEYDFAQWMKSRTSYYGQSTHLEEENVLWVYRGRMRMRGRRIDQVWMTPCLSDVPGYAPYAFRLAMEVVRV